MLLVKRTVGMTFAGYSHAGGTNPATELPRATSKT
jgi:hypothetical protein